MSEEDVVDFGKLFSEDCTPPHEAGALTWEDFVAFYRTTMGTACGYCGGYGTQQPAGITRCLVCGGSGNREARG